MNLDFLILGLMDADYWPFFVLYVLNRSHINLNVFLFDMQIAKNRFSIINMRAGLEYEEEK